MGSMRPRVGDVFLALLVTVVSVAGTVAAHRWAGHGMRALDGFGVGFVVVAGLSLAWRRRAPLVVLGVVAVAVSAYLVSGYRYGPVLLALLVAVYSAARHRPPRTAGIAAGVALLLLWAHTVVTGQWAGLVPASAWVLVPFAAGLVARTQSESVARQRAEALRRRVDDERLRIAQEVHDVVGHGLAAIKMQADVALHVLEKKPEQAETALSAISRTSSDALDELRATLAVVRSGTGQGPEPGLRRVHDLVNRTRDAGAEVSLRVRGDPPELPKPVDLTGYRILQESLTNVLRHSREQRADVTVDYTPEEVTIEVTNPSPTSAGGDGLGIPGMRRRVEALGGQFSAGASGGRFRVHARLPIGAQP
ncbi:sensor histidine kinase [Saccharopolyspora rhizosphaerae]|uniref:histidine kinase n=1 Tax=Saccharopolyspora rhizosphaerae TaxID=2492662 RepID=A0A426K0G8_9PSEU|nr:sensor histidine kinase [Saccharopolyspora rhizosphaerae]RRO18899.1 sensor histidine kinase [Saccharopolyspora rhizosphaerae]